MKTLLLLLALVCPLFAQQAAIPFSLAGGGLSVSGSFTSGTNTMAGTASMGGHSGKLLSAQPVLNGAAGIWWRWVVKIDGTSYVIWIGSTTGVLGGYWFTPGNPGNATKLV